MFKKTFNRKGIAIIVLMLLVFTGCAAMQISKQTDDPLVIATAAYLDARRWYNEAQVRFIEMKVVLPKEDIAKYNGVLNDIRDALNTWGIALSLKSLNPENYEAFKASKDKLIDYGFFLLVK